MNKPKRHKSPVIQKLQANRSSAEFEKTKKRMQLAAKIADGMKAKGWNNGDLARELDQHNSVISKWLSGTHNFTADTLFDIEEKLSIKLISVTEDKPQVLVKKYVAVVKSNNQHGQQNKYSPTTVMMTDKKGTIHITASPLEKHQSLGLPLFNVGKYDC
ncbi:MAG TPA: helix-turn-helix transcriptional regulator [Lacibacter sp.]|jgi:ribosome-binding protein aMBF1 (putative translation factor)|nr:helix-turn-helix transcriptional regulator [Lacibacter sp.]